MYEETLKDQHLSGQKNRTMVFDDTDKKSNSFPEQPGQGQVLVCAIPSLSGGRLTIQSNVVLQ